MSAGFDFALAAPSPADDLAPLRDRIAAACRGDEAEAVRALIAGSPPRAGRARGGAGARLDARAGGARRALERGRRRRADARVLARQPRGHRAHVPRRGAAAHSRRGDARPADPRQDRPGRLARARRRSRRRCSSTPRRGACWSPASSSTRAARARSSRRWPRCSRKGGEPLIRKGVRPRDAPPRPAVRHRPDDRRGARQRARARGARLPLLVRHAGRGGDDRRRRRALLRRLRARDPRDRPRGGRARRHRRARHLGQALGAASALLARAARARAAPSCCRASLALARLARSYDIGFNIDAEEADRLDLSLDLLERARAATRRSRAGTASASSCRPTRSARAHVIDWLVALARRTGRRLMVRLVKGAYWDSEIKRAQVDGLAGYPVFTRKVHTDVSLPRVRARRCSRRRTRSIRSSRRHNALTLAAVHTLAGDARRTSSSACTAWARRSTTRSSARTSSIGPCRIYAPVGSHETLLAYLVRRLLENGANTLVRQPHRRPGGQHRGARRRSGGARRERRGGAPHPHIPLPRALLPGPPRIRSGLDLADDATLARSQPRSRRRRAPRAAAPILGVAVGRSRARRRSRSAIPRDRDDVVGTRGRGRRATTSRARSRPPSTQAARGRATPAAERAACLERAADLLEAERATLHRARRARGRQDARRTRSPKCARRSISCATTRRRRARELGGAPASRRSGRSSRITPVEFSARDLHRPGRARRSPPATRCSRSPPSRRR